MTNQYALGEVVVEVQQREAIRLNALETPNMQKTVVTERILPDRKIHARPVTRSGAGHSLCMCDGVTL